MNDHPDTHLCVVQEGELSMVKVIFAYDVSQEKQEEYLKATNEVIKSFWESHGCISYTVWQAEDGSFIKEMLFADQETRQKALSLPQSDAKAKEAVGLFAKYAVNTTRRACEQKV